MIRRLQLVPFVLLAVAGAAVAESESFVGAAACASCHPEQSARQGKSAHALSLHPAAQHPLAARFASNEWLNRGPEFRLRYTQSANGIRAQGYDKENVIDIPVEWAFGAGAQAVTLVTRIDSEWHLEHHFSYYSSSGAMAPTAGHAGLRPKTLPEAMGLPYKTGDPAVGILGCFECHSTGPVRISPGNILQPAEAGVRCEACHGPGRLHVQAASLGDSRRARALIANPKRSPAQEILVKCGQCHRPPASAGSTIDWNYSWNVRHQPVYLAQSQCMTKSAGRLSCLTCHDPHNPLKETTAATYRERCLACHDGRSARAVPVKGAFRKEGACATCHMPAVSPQPALRFTNHWIGVYDPAKPLRPRNH